MTQLILDLEGAALPLPESQKGGYTAFEDDFTVQIPMIAGNLVAELAGKVWRVSYQYGYFNDADKNKFIAACRKGKRKPITCSFLPNDSNEMRTAIFFVTSFTEPKFQWSTMFSGDGSPPAPLWADFSVELREVRPHG